MPRVKIDCIVSFSSEDPDNPASNLLESEISKKKWLGANKGDPSNSVVLQLNRCHKISAVHLGSYQSALVEVLVGRSEAPLEPYKVLVVNSMFLTPAESKRGDNECRVRTFSYDQLAKDVRDFKWDRVRIVCLQPYSKHCKYGLTFVHLFASEAEVAPDSVQPVAELFKLDTVSEDEETFKPGELFAVHCNIPTSTDVQIRQATVKAYNSCDTMSKIVKMPISKGTSETKRASNSSLASTKNSNRNREELLFTSNELKEKKEGEYGTDKQSLTKNMEQTKRHMFDRDQYNLLEDKSIDDKTAMSTSHNASPSEKYLKKNDNPVKRKSRDPLQYEPTAKRKNIKKDQRSGTKTNLSDILKPGARSSSPHKLLDDVVFVLSGYENPRRSQLRDKALAMGAKYSRDWTRECTHLICAFPNTPKLHSVRRSLSGDNAIIVVGDWIDECCERRRIMPWQWYATEPTLKVPPPQLIESDQENNAQTDDDTDDEIERVRQKLDANKLPKVVNKNVSKHKDLTENKIIEDSGEETDEDRFDNENNSNTTIDLKKCIPDIFEGYSFLIDESTKHLGFDLPTLKRYIFAYGGEVLEKENIDRDNCHIDYLITTSKDCNFRDLDPKPLLVSPEWIWSCHEALKLLPPDTDAIT